jgi:hypothetical protein
MTNTNKLRYRFDAQSGGDRRRRAQSGRIDQMHCVRIASVAFRHALINSNYNIHECNRQARGDMVRKYSTTSFLYFFLKKTTTTTTIPMTID